MSILFECLLEEREVVINIVLGNRQGVLGILHVSERLVRSMVQAIYQGLSERGAKRMSDLAETTGDDDAEAAAKEREANVRRAKKKQEEYARYNDVIVQLTMKRVIEGSQQNGSLSSKHKDIVVLNNAAKIVERARKENWEILRVEDLLGEEEELGLRLVAIASTYIPKHLSGIM